MIVSNPPNFRTEIGHDTGYHTINREERNFAAILYHLLLINDNLSKFTKFISSKFQIDLNYAAIYFEYAFLRDLWSGLDKRFWKDLDGANLKKRNLIIKFLKPANEDYLNSCSVEEFNKYFGSKSIKKIESPATWSIQYFDNNIPNDEFLKICKFKWCFNAKPDIVIHTTLDTAICIEVKWDSKEGMYPSDKKEKKIFSERNCERVGQLTIQQKVLSELLGVDAEYIYLIKKRDGSSSSQTYTWSEIFAQMDTRGCPRFILEWIERT